MGRVRVGVWEGLRGGGGFREVRWGGARGGAIWGVHAKAKRWSITGSPCLSLTISRRNIGTTLVGKALCFVPLLCFETIRQPLPYPYCRVDMQEIKAVCNAHCGYKQKL